MSADVHVLTRGSAGLRLVRMCLNCHEGAAQDPPCSLCLFLSCLNCKALTVV